MAIALNTPRGQGYKACCLGADRGSNPYWSIQHMIKWDEWDAGWYQAFSENQLGVDR